MADRKSAVSGNSRKDASSEKVTEVIRKLVTRRQFLKGTGAVGSVTLAVPISGQCASCPMVFDNPLLMIYGIGKENL